MDRDVKSEIQQTIQSNPVVVFMKGSRRAPMCGFSASVVRVFEILGVEFKAIDVLSDPAIRDAVKSFSSWPTIPQVYIGGEFLGGSDIVRDLYERGELEGLLRKGTPGE